MRRYINIVEGVSYPLADQNDWYGNCNYADNGGRMVIMTPDEYLSKVRPLIIDDTSRDNIDDLKNHIESGRTLDPLVIYPDGKEDGRHRAVAAKELGITRLPVIVFGDSHLREAFYHGTSTDQADYLAQHGFGTEHRSQGMSGAPEETRKFTCITPSKATGIWYAKSNLRNTDGGAVVQVRFDAHPYVVRGHSDIYKAFAKAGEEFGVPRHEDGQLDMTEIADVLVSHGYNAVAFKDGWSSGRATLAVLTPGEINYVRHTPK